MPPLPSEGDSNNPDGIFGSSLILCG